MARSIVKHPELVKVSETWKDNTLVLELDVAHIDKGKVIGKHGNVVNAMRTILSTAATHSKKRVMLEIID